MDLEALKSQFIEIFGKEPRIFRAPGRVNIIGEHTDHNDGFVLPAAIDKATYVALAKRKDRLIIARSIDLQGEISIDLDDANSEARTDWGRFVQGVAVLTEQAGHTLSGADLLIASDIPLGSGLSSSAALEVAVGFALRSLVSLDIDRMELARVGRAAEHRYAGVMSGIMDQFVSAHGQADHALLLDCRSLEWSAVPLVGASFVLCNTNVKHNLADSEYNRRRMECDAAAGVLGKSSLRDVALPDVVNTAMPDVLRRRARHVVTENARVLNAVAALKNNDLGTLGTLINESHDSLRDDFEVSCAELDTMVEIARRQPGVMGARMIGGGFGGCTINLVEPSARDIFRESIALQYRDETSIEPEIYDVNIGDGVAECI
ncbi:MAG: galactokinase [Pyrinomonadaceae bacterium]